MTEKYIIVGIVCLAAFIGGYISVSAYHAQYDRGYKDGYNYCKKLPIFGQ